MDDIDETGWFYVYGSPNGIGYTLVHPTAKNYRLQFRNTDTNSEFNVRTMNNGTWSSWKRCDNFGANTPADLASLLGGIKRVSFQTGNTAATRKIVFSNVSFDSMAIISIMKYNTLSSQYGSLYFCSGVSSSIKSCCFFKGTEAITLNDDMTFTLNTYSTVSVFYCKCDVTITDPE